MLSGLEGLGHWATSYVDDSIARDVSGPFTGGGLFGIIDVLVLKMGCSS